MDWGSVLIAVITSGIITTVLNTYFERNRHDRQERLVIYKLVVDIFSDFLNDFAYLKQHNQPILPEKIVAFNKMRMQTYGYLCIYADQKSIDAHEECVEYIFEVLEGKTEYEWSEIRNRAMRLLNSFRIDYDSALFPAVYNGNR